VGQTHCTSLSATNSVPDGVLPLSRDRRPAESITNTAVASRRAEPVTATAVVVRCRRRPGHRKTYEDLNGAPLYEGDAIQYVIGIGNLDTFTHTGVIVTDAIPDGTTTLTAAPHRRRRVGGSLVWMVGQPGAREVRTLTFQVTVDDGMVGQSIGGNVAEVVSDQVDDPVVTHLLRGRPSNRRAGHRQRRGRRGRATAVRGRRCPSTPSR